MKPIHNEETRIIVPWEPPYVSSPVATANGGWTSNLWICFPNKCAWCASEAVVGGREVVLGCANPRYLDAGKRALMNAAAIAGGLIAGGGLVGGTVYGLMPKPEEMEKIKNFFFRVQVPHCAAHAAADPREALELVGLANGLVALALKVRGADYAAEIAGFSEARVQADLARQNDQRIANELKGRSVSLSSLDDIAWPNLCVVCGTENPTERYEQTVGEGEQSQKISVPVCDKHVSIVERSSKLGMIVAVVLCGFFLLAGVASFWLKMSTGGHVALCLCAFPVAMGALVWLVMWIANRLVLGVNSSDFDIKSPVEISQKDGRSTLKFFSLEAARAFFELNKDKVV